MRNPDLERTEGHAAALTKPTFNLAPRALEFARLYARRADLTAAECARRAGYGKGARVRACELLRDQRVIRAVLHFGGLAFHEDRQRAMAHLFEIGGKEYQKGRIVWPRGAEFPYEVPFDARGALDRLTDEFKKLGDHVERLERVYESGLLRAS